GTQLAVGTVDGKVQIWDVVTSTKIRDFTGHSSRVGALAWNNNVLSTGGADRIIYQKGDQLASGGNANELYVWEKSNDHEPALKLEKHKAAVRALSWSPHDRNILVSGGGHLDRQICFWNTLDGRSLGVHNSKSQVCNLQWSPNANEIVSTHGWWRNDVIVWQYPSMKKLATLKGHTYRVLYFSLAPDGEDIVTGAGGDDNTLRFWKIFNTPRDKSLKKPDSDIDAKIKSINDKIRKEELMRQAAVRVKSQTSNTTVQTQCESNIENASRYIEYLTKEMEKLQLKQRNSFSTTPQSQ
ncbi:24629_t:CDS:2, partial [Entrophospora sp. SA101]